MISVPIRSPYRLTYRSHNLLSLLDFSRIDFDGLAL